MKSSVVSKSIFNGSAPYTPVLFFKKACRVLLVSLAASFTAIPVAYSAQYAGIVVDAKTGKVLYSEDADSLRYPASLTKMMTLYLTFEALEAGKINKNTPVPFSKNASAEPPSKLGVRSGNTITVEQAILSMVTRSANDSSTALGELLGGSEDRFARIMTNKARALGMTRTTYRNANGLPNTAQMTTARDQARLGIALRQHFPQYYSYFSTRSFKYGKQVIGNHNRLVGVVRGVDGIKTGYTNAAGFNLVTSAQVDGRSIVGVVLGGKSGGARDAKMKQLVGKYLPQASRNGKGKMIVQPETEPVIAAIEPQTPVAALSNRKSTNLPESGPVPGARYDDQPIEAAYAAPTRSAAVAAIAEDVMSAPQAKQLSAVAVPQPAPEYMPESSDASEPQHVDKVTTASTGTASGWVIQIGVSPSKQMAMNLLQTAQSKSGKVLSSATPFAVAINTGSSSVYRARFGGFDNQTSAVNACKALKRKGINCWASIQ